jgi:hypothetical protein
MPGLGVNLGGKEFWGLIHKFGNALKNPEERVQIQKGEKLVLGETWGNSGRY